MCKTNSLDIKKKKNEKKKKKNEKKKMKPARDE